MKQVSVIAMVVVGFVAGIAFVYSCSGGGNNALAFTDVTGIETRLDTKSNQITSLHNSITGADIMTIKVFDNPSWPGFTNVSSDPISVNGYREIHFMTLNNNIAMYAYHIAGGFTRTISISPAEYGTMPAYGNTLVIEGWNMSSSAESGFLVVKLVP